MAGADTTYGSDKDGLVWGYVFKPGHAATSIGADEAAAHLAQRLYDEGDDFMWLHFSAANVAAERWLAQHLRSPDGFLDFVHQGATSTRVEQADASLLAVLHDVTFDSADEEAEAATVSVFVEARIMVSARRTPLRSVDRLRSAVRSGERFRSAAELLAHLLRDQADVLVDIVRQTAGRVDAIEDVMLTRSGAAWRGQLGRIRRMLVRLQRVLAPEPAALFRLLNRPPAWLGELDQQELRQAAEELAAAASDATALAERVRLLQEEAATHINEQNNRILFLLTLVTVLALPFNVVGALFGMNVGGIPFGSSSHGFWVIVVFVAAFTGLASIVALRGRDR
jgi:zinc transporter